MTVARFWRSGDEEHKEDDLVGMTGKSRRMLLISHASARVHELPACAGCILRECDVLLPESQERDPVCDDDNVAAFWRWAQV